MMRKGLTLIELLVVIAIISILATTVVVAINPARQMAKVRDSQRESHLTAILSAILQYSSEHSGDLPDTDGDPDTSNFPTSPTCIGTAVTCFNLGAAGEVGETIVPDYIYEIPYDPKTGDATNTGYTIYVDANGYLHAGATGEAVPTITIVR
jgi:prepilin-type N-terminal cleavage/methylation domain-containing protein